jgi:predicted GNAT superfamily acetyltransferase
VTDNSVADISELKELEELRELEALFASIWERPDEPPISADLLRALAHSGNYVTGARTGGRLVGGLVGWLGGDPRHELHMHSHILGVDAGRQVRGLGFELKQHQRRWCLERGMKRMEWTTDPLVRRNGYFNLSKLGARAREYLVNFYGAMADGLNAGEESDRLLIGWQLDSAQAEMAATGRSAEPDVEELLRGDRRFPGARPYMSGARGHRGDQAFRPSDGALLEACTAPGDWRCSHRRVPRHRRHPGRLVRAGAMTGPVTLFGCSPWGTRRLSSSCRPPAGTS